MNAARQTIRQKMELKEDEGKSVDERVKHLNDVATFLKRNIVQGKMNNDGRYALNIHSSTELGDNDSIKTTKSTFNPATGGGCCGGGSK